MELTIKDLRTSLGKELLKVAAKCSVRECDETSKGKFVAYVDEGKDSFDVNVETDAAGTFKTFGCDCKSERKICQHIAALMVFVSSAPEAKTKPTAKVKIRESELLANEVNPALLLEWLKDRLRTDKEFELAFLSAFRPAKTTLDPEKIKLTMTDAQKAVMGRTRNIDAKMINRLLSLWSKVHEPVLNYYIAHPGNPDAFNCYATILEYLLRFPEQYYFSSAKYGNYRDELYEKGFAAVHATADEETWKTAIGFYINAAFLQDQIGGFFLDRLIQSLNTHQRERRIFLAEGMLKFYGSRDEGERNYQLQLSYQMLKLTVAQGLFNKYSSLFIKPLNYSPYDSMLIETLISLGQYDKAIDISNVILSSERYPERRLHYLRVLKQLYQKTENTTGLLKTLTTLVPLTYDFNDFRFLSQHLDKSEFESIRSDMYHKAISSMHAREDMFRFVFNMLAEEKDYDKMIRYLPKTQSYESILPWIELLAEYDKDACFNELLKITDIHFNQGARLAAEELASLVMEIYPVEYVRSKLLAHLSKYRYMQSSTYLRVLAQRFEFS